MPFEEPLFENEDMHELPPFKVFISHGRSDSWRELAEYIETGIGVETISLETRSDRGSVDVEQLDDATEDAAYAIIVMTADDDGPLDRENAAIEAGFFLGLLGPGNVLVLRQSGVEEFSGCSGIKYEVFEGRDIRSAFESVAEDIEDARSDYEDEPED